MPTCVWGWEGASRMAGMDIMEEEELWKGRKIGRKYVRARVRARASRCVLCHARVRGREPVRALPHSSRHQARPQHRRLPPARRSRPARTGPLCAVPMLPRSRSIKWRTPIRARASPARTGTPQRACSGITRSTAARRASACGDGGVEGLGEAVLDAQHLPAARGAVRPAWRERRIESRETAPLHPPGRSPPLPPPLFRSNPHAP